ncbi:hypothetical protein O9992_07975 [Vibrio lentus]|nr:hypothetical protein [Vibrio lentus]
MIWSKALKCLDDDWQPDVIFLIISSIMAELDSKSCSSVVYVLGLFEGVIISADRTDDMLAAIAPTASALLLSQ